MTDHHQYYDSIILDAPAHQLVPAPPRADLPLQCPKAAQHAAPTRRGGPAAAPQITYAGGECLTSHQLTYLSAGVKRTVSQINAGGVPQASPACKRWEKLRTEAKRRRCGTYKFHRHRKTFPMTCPNPRATINSSPCPPNAPRFTASAAKIQP